MRERGAYPVSASLNRNKATQVRGYSRIFKVLSTTAYHSYNTVGARPQSAARAKRMNTSNQSRDYRELCSAHWCIVFLRSTGTLQKVATNVTARTIIKGRAMKRYHKIVSWNSLEYFSCRSSWPVNCVRSFVTVHLLSWLSWPLQNWPLSNFSPAHQCWRLHCGYTLHVYSMGFAMCSVLHSGQSSTAPPSTFAL